MPRKYTPEERRVVFWSRVDRTAGPDACWPWTGTHHGQGYGHAWVGNTNRRAHRLAWEYVNGPIPPGLWVLHRCDNPACCNPAHLFLGTRQDNIDDMMAKGRNGQVTGERHYLHQAPERVCGENNGNAKLTAEKVRRIRALHAAGGNQYALAREFGVSQGTVSSVVLRKSWAHVG